MIYKHFKGGEYRLLLVGRDASTMGDEKNDGMMVYVALGHGRSEPGTLWVRPEREWEEKVLWPDGVMRKRFERIDEPAGGG